MWRMVNYEVSGRSHKLKNIPCQDKTIARCMNNTYCIALSDGAGSACKSHYGAEIVVNSISEHLMLEFDSIYSKDEEEAKENIIELVLSKLKVGAIRYGCGIEDLAATLLVVAIKGDKFIVGHIGDGIVGCLKNDSLFIASKPYNGEYINSTVFVTSKGVSKYTKLIKGDVVDIDGFVLMSDGSGDSFYIRSSEELSYAVKRIIKWTSAIKKKKIYLMIKDSFDNLVVNNTKDDCSIAIISKKPVK